MDFSKFQPQWQSEQFFQICDDDKELAEELIELYRDQFEQSYESFKKAHDAKDQKNIIFFAHDMKGASANLGGAVVSGICLELEKMGKEGNLGDMSGQIDKLRKEQDALMAIFDEVLENFPEADSEEGSSYETDDEESD